MEKDNQKEIYKIEEKLIKDGRKELLKEIAGESETAVNTRLLNLAKYEQDIITSKNEDAELTSLSNQVKELKAPYAEALKANKLIRRYITLYLREFHGTDAG